MNPRSRLLTAVVVACVLAAAVGFFLVMQKSPEAARLRLLVDVLLLAALTGTAFVVTRNPLERQEELLDAMRALARGARDRRLDYDRFGELEDVARAYNELAAALTEHEDPNLGPIKSKRRQERPAWMDPDASDHPQLGEIRVISKKQKAAEAMQAEERAARARELAQKPEPVVEHRSKTKARAKKREREAAQQKVAADADSLEGSAVDDSLEGAAVPSDEPTVAPTRAREKAVDRVKSPPLEEANTAPPAARVQGPREESEAPVAAAVSDDDDRASAAPDNDTAIDELLRASKSEPAYEPSHVDEPEEEPRAASAESDDDDGEESGDPSREKTLPPFDMSALFQEFVEAKRAHDESTDDLEYDVFAETLVDEMSRLLEAHACRAVRFEVRVQDGEVSLLPRLIR